MRTLAPVLLIVSLCAARVPARGADIAVEHRILLPGMRIDSLGTAFCSLEGEPRGVGREKRAGAGRSGEQRSPLCSEERKRARRGRRSRKVRVEELLKDVEEHPGRLRFNGSAAAIIQGVSGGESSSYTGTGSFNIYVHTAFGPRSIMFFDLEAAGGAGPDAAFPTFSGLNDDASSLQSLDGVDRLRVREAWAEFELSPGRATVTLGKIDLTNYFDINASANDETTQFISGAFVNGAAFDVPEPSPGLLVQATMLRRFSLKFGLASADNAGSELFDDLYGIGGVGVILFPESGREGALRFHAYRNPYARRSPGFGFSFDQAISGAWNLFARYGRNGAELSEWFGIESAWSAGASFATMLAGKTMELGGAWGETVPRDGDLMSEGVAELYARLQPNDRICLSPHVQAVWNAAGSADRIFAAGLRVSLVF